MKNSIKNIWRNVDQNTSKLSEIQRIKFVWIKHERDIEIPMHVGTGSPWWIPQTLMWDKSLYTGLNIYEQRMLFLSLEKWNADILEWKKHKLARPV